MSTRTSGLEGNSRNIARQFASDNYAGICPDAWRALELANADHAPAYGDDRWTTRASDLIRELFEIDCEVFFCFNGTAANSLSISHLCESYHSVICHRLAHLETDECGAPEFFSNGTKILVADGQDGKISPSDVAHLATKRTDIHYPKPRVLSLTQATEMGTVYSIGELDALREAARRHGLKMHMDGARFANAIATLGCAPKEVTWKVGVDVLCFGGTKNGLPVGEAVVFFNKEQAKEFDYRCKQGGQLASKMRFITAGWVGLLEEGAWQKCAKNANARARLLHEGLRSIPGVKILVQPQANSVFAELPPKWIESLRADGWRFYVFIAQGGCRFMCSWDTTEDDVQALVDAIRQVSEKHPM